MPRSVLAWVLLGAVVGPASLPTREPHQDGRDPSRLGRYIAVGFPLEGHSHLVAIPHGMTPAKGITELWDGRGDFVKKVFTPNDLKGRVRPRTVEQALALARLFSAPDTCKFGSVWHTKTDSIQAIEVFTTQETPQRKYAVITPEDARRLKLKPAKVRWVADHWAVERNLVVLFWWKKEAAVGRIYHSAESVFPNGRYTHRVAFFVPEGFFPGRLLPLWIS